MLRHLLLLAAFLVFGAGAAAFEAWLDHRGFDRVSAALLAAFTLGLIVLIILIGMYLGRRL